MMVLIRIGVMALMVIFLMVDFSFCQSTAEQIWTKGVEYAEQGKFKEAKEEFEKAWEVDPAIRALKVIEDALDQKIKSKAAIHFFKGIAYIYKEQWDESITEFNNVIEINPRYAGAYGNRGAAYAETGQYEKAISDFNKFIEINPRCAFTYFNRGHAYAIKSQYKRAISDFNKAIEINPNYAEAYGIRGLVYAEMGRYDMACSDWKRACKLGDCRNWSIKNKIQCFGK